MSRYGWKAKYRTAHVIQRLAERYGLHVTREEVADVEVAINTLRQDHFIPNRSHTDSCFFTWKDKLIHGIVSRSAYPDNPRHILTVLPNE